MQDYTYKHTNNYGLIAFQMQTCFSYIHVHVYHCNFRQQPFDFRGGGGAMDFFGKKDLFPVFGEKK